MRPQEKLDQLRQIISNGNLPSLSREELEMYADALCFSNASDYFSDRQFSQVCETIRLLLIKKYTDEIDKQTVSLQHQNLNLQKENIFLQRIVTVLMIVTVFTAAIQIYIALRPNSQLEEQLKLRRAHGVRAHGVRLDY